MKTTYPLEDIEHFLNSQYDTSPTVTKEVTEGHSSQVVAYTEPSGAERILRIRSDYDDLLADKFAYDSFGSILPIPAIIDIGKFDSDSYYCISERAQGVIMSELPKTELIQAIPEIQKVFADTFLADISEFSGYGDVNPATGKATYNSWREALENELHTLGVEVLMQHAVAIHLPTEYVLAFVSQFNDNLPFVSEKRRLLHGDPGGDNLLIKDGRVTALIDWEQMAYGDWLRDYSRFAFWNKYTYGDAQVFATKFGLEGENITERTAVYWALHALRNIEFAATQKNDKVAEWMRKNASNKIIKLTSMK